MSDQLTKFFNLASNYRTSNIIIKRVILNEAMPKLASETTSVRLKGAISKFLQENANEPVQSSAGR